MALHIEPLCAFYDKACMCAERDQCLATIPSVTKLMCTLRKQVYIRRLGNPEANNSCRYAILHASPANLRFRSFAE